MTKSKQPQPQPPDGTEALLAALFRIGKTEGEYAQEELGMLLDDTEAPR